MIDIILPVRPRRSRATASLVSRIVVRLHTPILRKVRVTLYLLNGAKYRDHTESRLTAMLHSRHGTDGGAQPHIETYVQKLKAEDENDHFQPWYIKH
jgi:hypothetical protein